MKKTLPLLIISIISVLCSCNKNSDWEFVGTQNCEIWTTLTERNDGYLDIYKRTIDGEIEFAIKNDEGIFYRAERIYPKYQIHNLRINGSVLTIVRFEIND